MAVRPIDGNEFMKKLTLDTSKGFYGEFMDGSDTAYTSREIDRFIEDMPTLTPPNDPLTCEGCLYAPDLPYEVHCRGCARLYTDHYRRPPEGEEDA